MEKKIKVLLADNSEYFGVPCATTMRSHSLDVQMTEKDGRRVVETVAQTRPDVVIMDFFLPGLDAIGVIKGIQGLHLPQKPQIMIMSGFDNPTLEREALLAGADYYFLKPFDADEMAERILLLCKKSRMPEPVHRPAAAPTSGGSLEIQVTEIIHQIGVPAHIKGYQYLRDAILMAIEDDDIINAVTKRLYPAVAKKHGPFLPGGTGHPPRHRGRLGPGRRGCAQFLFRLYHTQRPGQAYQLGIHRYDQR